MGNQCLQKYHTDYEGKYKGIWYAVREHHARRNPHTLDGKTLVSFSRQPRCVTFSIEIKIKYIDKKYRSCFRLSKEEIDGLLDYPHKNLECFFSDSDSFRTELGYELIGYSKDDEGKVVDLVFGADDYSSGYTCFSDDSTFTVEQVAKEAEQAIDTFLKNVPDYCPNN